MSSPGASGSGIAAVHLDDEDDDSVSMRLQALELHSRAQARMLHEMRAQILALQQDFLRTNTVLHGVQIDVARLDLWRTWLADVWRWMLNSMRAFPWP